MPFAGFIHPFVSSTRDASALAFAGLLVEALELRDCMLELPYSQLSLTMDDVDDIINFICTDFCVLRVRFHNK
jgi:hypothetical protein